MSNRLQQQAHKARQGPDRGKGPIGTAAPVLRFPDGLHHHQRGDRHPGREIRVADRHQDEQTPEQDQQQAEPGDLASIRPSAANPAPVKAGRVATRGYMVRIWLHGGYMNREAKRVGPKTCPKCLILLVGPLGVEPSTNGL